MTLSLWRSAHLALAVFSAAFLVLASTTGVILAVDAIQEKTAPYKIANFDTISLQETLPILHNTYPEITEIIVDHNQFVNLQGLDQDGNNVNAYVDAKTAKIIGIPKQKGEFIQWTTALHRSLFLKETGRFIVGFVSFLLFLISLSGLALMLKQQKGIKALYTKIVKENFAQYYHLYLGRLSLLPIIILAVSGTYLTLEKFNFFREKNTTETSTTAKETVTTNINFFKTTLLSDVKKIEFPFSNDPEEFYVITLHDREVEINQQTGAIVSQTPFPLQAIANQWNLDLHTGRTSITWALVLALASINILFFIYSGFSMTLKRSASRIKNTFNAAESEFILLVGSENGSTLAFANAIQKQLIAQGKKVFLAELNSYTNYPKAAHLIVLTATHGLGDAPANATAFLSRLQKTTQQQPILFSVVGFGSQAYPDFCAFAHDIDNALAQQNWAQRSLKMHSVNNKSTDEFVAWIRLWNTRTGIQLATTASLYHTVPKGLEKIKVVSKTVLSKTENSFLITLQTSAFSKFTSGDLLAVYPANDNQERLYSIGKVNRKIQLVVKLYPNGLGSNYLYHLDKGSSVMGRIIENKSFHLPKKDTPVVMISNGTGIAPFLGMIAQNKNKTELHLYCGFRQETATVSGHKKFAEEMLAKQQLNSYQIALSRGEKKEYVMDLIQRDANFFANLLHQGGVLMICGSLAMQQDVEKVLGSICVNQSGQDITFYKNKGQLLTDCY